ncbi:MAG: hypothetical protein WCF24_07675, partial [Acidimicrobiales bacterium]
MAAAHLSARELSLWLRPKLMLALLDSSEEQSVLFLAPDSAVFEGLDIVDELLENRAVLRVPITTATEPALSAKRHAEFPGELRVWAPGFLAANSRA